jgi:hypothetical protein
MNCVTAARSTIADNSPAGAVPACVGRAAMILYHMCPAWYANHRPEMHPETAPPTPARRLGCITSVLALVTSTRPRGKVFDAARGGGIASLTGDARSGSDG